MKSLSHLLPLGLLLAGCGHPATSPVPADAPAATSVVGSWRLAAFACYCPAGSQLPNQRLTLAADQHFQFYVDGKLLSEGTYALGTGSACSAAPSPDALLKVTLATPNTYAPAGNYSLRGDTLVIDQCLAADGPRYTFQRER